MNDLEQWLADLAVLIEQDVEPKAHHFISFLNEPALCLQLVDVMNALEEPKDEESFYYSACIFAMDICVAQLQSAKETGHKLAAKILDQLMSQVAASIRKGGHSLSFWLPILNAFYDVQVTLSPDLCDAYFELASEGDDFEEDEDDNHLEAIRDMILELKDLSVFDIAENFFAQSHAMPASFFADLVCDLYNIEEGQDVALLALLHPNHEVRDIVVEVMDELMEMVVISPQSLSRLQAIKNWYPMEYHKQFNRWITTQRKKGVIFHNASPLSVVNISASEVDGSGAQGVFIHLKDGKKNRLCGLLFKAETGIKDAWITPKLSAHELKQYFIDAFDDSVSLRPVNQAYLLEMTAHFLEKTIACGGMPDLHLLEIQELLGVHLLPKALDLDACIDSLVVQISPFTKETMRASLKRSKAWLKTKSFTESWYIENAHVDKLVNQSSSFVDGVKTCNLEQAIKDVFEQEMETHRGRWLFHFLWVSLWLKAKAKKNEKLWQDSLILAYAIHTGEALNSLPVLQEIVLQTVVNSIETMAERRTHLT